MTASRQTITAPGPPPGSVEPPRARARWRPARALGMPRLRHVALAAVLAFSAFLNVYRLSQNGYANVFYSAGVSSMLRSLHNFVFVSFDPGGLISVDKPPLGLWVQALSAKLFGFAPLSLLLPEALAGVLTVALLYRLLVVRFGAFAAIAGALALAVFPSFVAVSRDNGVDPLLILLMLLACGAGLRAIETGRWAPLLWCALLVALAFNTKTLAAYLVVPGIALGYLICAPGSIPHRVVRLLAAGLLMLVVSFSWIAFVESTPASQRPYAGSSTNNTELGLAFTYNGFGRVEGQSGGPGRVPVRSGAIVHSLPAPGGRAAAGGQVSSRPRVRPGAAARPAATQPVFATLAGGRVQNPIAFGGPPGPLRLFGVGLGDQGGWMLPFGFFGLVAAAALLWRRTRPGVGPQTEAAPAGGDSRESAPASDPPGARDRRLAGLCEDPRLAAVLVFGGWFLVEAVLLSVSRGIVHPYYMAALAPGAAAMAGVGAGAFLTLARRRPRDWLLILAPCAVATTVAVQLVLMHREDYLLWFAPALICGAAIGVAGLTVSRRLAPGAMAVTFCLLLVAPTAYATTTWLAPVEGTFPAAGPNEAAGAGGVGIDGADLRRDRVLIG